MKKKTKLIILMIAIMAVVTAGTLAILQRRAENTSGDLRKRSISVLYTPWKSNTTDNMETGMALYTIGHSGNDRAIMIVSEESYIPAQVNAITKLTVVLAVIALATAALMAFIAFNFDTRIIVEDVSEDE